MSVRSEAILHLKVCVWNKTCSHLPLCHHTDFKEGFYCWGKEEVLYAGRIWSYVFAADLQFDKHIHLGLPRNLIKPFSLVYTATYSRLQRCQVHKERMVSLP
ncbi:zinc finger and BTB domain-containing protein 2 [Platysternon megacephalum]|uniref:Zinc finger and BTB domain-containing protein 2 n=1 Tax=Platysternon megacephalum TaxID=55544 RepID=A0A4D9ESH6_9SAUR|nr:zinc finger and BTB domain-containing protein 2 [Platysternon megacephalum]